MLQGRFCLKLFDGFGFAIRRKKNRKLVSVGLVIRRTCLARLGPPEAEHGGAIYLCLALGSTQGFHCVISGGYSGDCIRVCGVQTVMS